MSCDVSAEEEEVLVEMLKSAAGVALAKMHRDPSACVRHYAHSMKGAAVLVSSKLSAVAKVLQAACDNRRDTTRALNEFVQMLRKV